MWNTCMRSGGCGIIGVGLGTYFVSTHGRKLGIRKGYIGRTMVNISEGETYVIALGQ